MAFNENMLHFLFFFQLYSRLTRGSTARRTKEKNKSLKLVFIFTFWPSQHKFSFSWFYSKNPERKPVVLPAAGRSSLSGGLTGAVPSPHHSAAVTHRLLYRPRQHVKEKKRADSRLWTLQYMRAYNRSQPVLIFLQRQRRHGGKQSASVLKGSGGEDLSVSGDPNFALQHEPWVGC